jgi:cobaltochelatase CobN
MAPGKGLCDPAACDFDKPLVVIIFYRSYLVADDLDPFIALHAGFEAKGYAALSLFAPSLKEPAAKAQIEAWLRQLSPVAIVNATGFSALDEHGHSPLDIAGAPVFQIALATSGQEAWAEGARGLSPADLAMHVVLPEIDGRVFMGVASFKAGDPRDAALGFARNRHLSQSDRVAAIVEKVSGWIALAAKPAAERRVALVLSTYPGRPEAMAHAVGLDALSSTQAILADMAQAGYCVTPGHDLAMALQAQTLSWRLSEYRRALADLPAPLQQAIHDCWGAPEDDPAVIDGAFRFPAINLGHAMVALQPERGERAARDGDYHDLSRHPRHAYVAFYLWLKAQGFDAMVHVGAHGTLEWLPGKAVALSDQCWPEVLKAGLPVIYPFIVNDPGEAAQAKRRIGAVTIGHVPPPWSSAPKAQGWAGLRRYWMNFPMPGVLIPRVGPGCRPTLSMRHELWGWRQNWALIPMRRRWRSSPASTASSVISRRASLATASTSLAGANGEAESRGLLTALAGQGWRRDRRAHPFAGGATFCRRGAISTRLTHGPYPRARPMRRASCWPRN